MNLNDLKDAKKAIDEKKINLLNDAANVIEAELNHIFDAYPDVKNIMWVQKNSEYNDEGMYPGFAGPIVNGEIDNRDYYSREWIYGDCVIDKRLDNLRTIFDILDVDLLVDLYDDSTIVIVTRDENGSLIFDDDYIY